MIEYVKIKKLFVRGRPAITHPNIKKYSTQMGKGLLDRDAKILHDFQNMVGDELGAAVTAALRDIPVQVAKVVVDLLEGKDYVDKYVSRKKKERQKDASPVRKEDKKKKKKTKSEKTKKVEGDEKPATAKPTKKRKDPNSPKGVRNSRTFFKLANAAIFAGLDRKERQDKEDAMFKALTPDQLQVFKNETAKDQIRYDAEMALYKKGEYVAGKTVVQAPAPVPEAKPKKHKKKAKVEAKKKSSSSSSSSSSVDSGDFNMGEESDD